MKKSLGLVAAIVALAAVPALAQQTGSIAGRVVLSDGSGLSGVVVEASSDVLPRPRAVTTTANGSYTLPQLPPGAYTVTFEMDGMATVTRTVQVALDQQARLDVTMGLETVTEEIQVVASSLIDPSSTAIQSTVSEQMIENVPTGQDYRDLQKLIPGVQYTENTTRGPSAGGSGQDNTYLFDGVSVTLPMFGTLSAEPSTHDVDQVSIIKGGAKAVDFNRAGGFTMDTVSKSGTNRFHGAAEFQIQTSGMTGDQDEGTNLTFDEDRDWTTISLGGPIVGENLFAYGSYYRPTSERENSANVYGSVPDFESTRNEYFGKLTWTPSSNLLLNGSYRDSDRENRAASVGQFSAASTAAGTDVSLKILNGEGSWVINDRNFATFKFTDFTNENRERPDNRVSAQPVLDGSVRLDVGNLDQQGHFFVPNPIAGQDAFNAFIDPLIQRYGFLDNGVRRGGGDVGGHNLFNDQDFFRQSFQVGYDWLIGDGAITHDLHVGFQWMSDEEELSRTSNGWGIIDVPGGRETFENESGEDVPIFYRARLYANRAADSMRTEFESQSIEINDTIRWNDWTFNVGVMISQDTLYGQGLRRTSATTSGFEVAPGSRYEMYKVDWDDLIQPRLGATWAYNGRDTAYVSYARYNPSASSLPRAAAWDRNTFLRTVDVFFDADGNQLGVSQVSGSSGKLFSPGLEPRYTDEYILGTSRQITDRWTGRAYARHRYSANFWEDTHNNSRIAPGFDPPPGVPRDLYMPTNNLVSASSYVIAQLDGAFTKFYEVNLDAERRAGNTFLRGSYTWGHYYGNFDQDNTTTNNDLNIFIGSSNLADGVGRQVWDNRYGNLKGDRRHLLKAYGYYRVPWDATVGAFAVYQSGEPWEVWDVQPYRDAGRTTSTVSTGKFAEPAGSRTSDSHYQLDLNYTHNFRFADRYNLQLVGDLFNVTDNQTGYNINPFATAAGFGQPRSYYAPRRFQLAARFQF